MSNDNRGWHNDSLGHSIAATLGHFRSKMNKLKKTMKPPWSKLPDELTQYNDVLKQYIKDQFKKIELTWTPGEVSHTNKDVDRAIEKAMELFATPYGAKIPSVSPLNKAGSKVSLVCSALIPEIYPDYGFENNLESQFNHKHTIKVDSLEKAKRGDLIFFRYRDDEINHVGMVVGFTGKADCRQVWFLHASSSYGVILSRTGEAGGPPIKVKGKKDQYKPWNTYIAGYRRPHHKK